MQFVVKDVSDQQMTLLDNALRMVFQLLSAWRLAAADKLQPRPASLSSSDQHSRPDLATTLHMAEGLALVMLSHCRLTTRRICLLILKEVRLEARLKSANSSSSPPLAQVKQLFKILGSLRGDSTVLDALDKATPEVVDSCSHLMPLQDKTAALNAASLDFQWLTGSLPSLGGAATNPAFDWHPIHPYP